MKEEFPSRFHPVSRSFFKSFTVNDNSPIIAFSIRHMFNIFVIQLEMTITVMKKISVATLGRVVLSSDKKEDQFRLSICLGSDLKIQLRWWPWTVRNHKVEVSGYPTGPEIFYKPSISTDFPRFTSSSGTMILQPARLHRPGYSPAYWSGADHVALKPIIRRDFTHRHQF